MSKYQFILLSSALVVIAYVLLLIFKMRNAAGDKREPERPQSSSEVQDKTQTPPPQDEA